MNQTVHLCVSYSDKVFSITYKWSFNQDKDLQRLTKSEVSAAEEKEFY